ncbi:MOSC domain-containing protein [Cytobacillus sp. IB215665]|uniref:MOSC domain-containing protein n=1 Tax=Cytobacillus sp. IB215665 TaxID=3097357 RepID=UPI002A0E6C49|nr:MOSC domain-containing protein [Cytobacillus sp. IB215665]MDX8365627.1 MOSC domain-containing protein [Cytobacillus sp. IB215665]
MKVGRVSKLYRYPVKAFGGERLKNAPIHHHGIWGDRSFAYKINSKFLTIDKLPELVNYNAKYTIANGGPKVSITSIDGTTYDWGDLALDKKLSTLLDNESISKVSHDPESEKGSYWENHILLTSTASLAKISELCKSELLDIRRFRPNIVIDLESNIAFEEETWIGKELSINGTRYKLDKKCVRCAYVNVDPTNSTEINPNILKTIVKEREAFFGVYASVVATGEIYEGSQVFLHDNDPII